MTADAFIYDAATDEVYEAMIYTPFLIGLILAIISIIFGFFVILFSFILKKKVSYKFIMIIKMILVPYYITNFVLWVLYGLGFFFVSWLLLFGFIFIGVVFTYITMLVTSAVMLSRIIPDLIKNRLPRVLLIIAIPCCFIYFADVVISVILYVFDRKSNEVKPNVVEAEIIEPNS